ncbi:hypothetical protein FRC12_020265 [Ceratobasidium sp. 428]|nr:hypothetical protein FRC12_020265 [Ceratobasidium sp. 428]
MASHVALSYLRMIGVGCLTAKHNARSFPYLLSSVNQYTAPHGSRLKGDSAQQMKNPKKPHRPPHPNDLVKTRSGLKRFFSQFEGFDYDPTKPYMSEFNRLVRLKKWDGNGQEYKKARREINNAGVGQFNSLIGSSRIWRDNPVCFYLSSVVREVDVIIQLSSPKEEPWSVEPGHGTQRPLRPKEIIQARFQLRKFFSQFEGFKYNPAQPYMSEFDRLVKMKGWKEGGKRHKKAKKGIDDAGVKQFNKTIGTEVDDLSAWHRLFKNIKGEELPKTVEECQIRAQTLQVNICDVLDAAAGGPKAQDFKQEHLLSSYTLESDKIFPREHVLAGRILEFLLRRILCPPKDTDCLPLASSPDNVIYL